MLLETGGAARFQIPPFEGVTLREAPRAEKLILDGQQRLTSLPQVLKTVEPVETRDEKGREINLVCIVERRTSSRGTLAATLLRMT